MHRIGALFLLYLIPMLPVTAQSNNSVKWWNPAEHEFPVIEGQAWAGQTEEPFDRPGSIAYRGQLIMNWSVKVFPACIT